MKLLPVWEERIRQYEEKIRKFELFWKEQQTKGVALYGVVEGEWRIVGYTPLNDFDNAWLADLNIKWS